MKIDIVVSRYSLCIDDILPQGEVRFSPAGNIINVHFATEKGTSCPGRYMLDDHIDKITQDRISSRIKLALIEINKLLSGFNKVGDNERSLVEYY